MGCGGACGSQASELTLKLNLRVSRTSPLSRRDGVAYHWYILTKSQLHRGNSLAPRLNRRQDQGWTLDTALEMALCLHVSLLHRGAGARA